MLDRVIAPKEVTHEKFFLDVLAPKYNEVDFEAWISSKDNLVGIFGPNNDWPGEVTDLAHNLKDLENHEREFIAKEAYAYTILSPDKSQCIGCLYIRPMNSVEYDSRIDFWFRDSSLELESIFFDWLKLWLFNDLGIKKSCFPGRSITWEKYYIALVE